MKQKFQFSKKGVTLIEILVCVAIFSILSLTVYGIFVSIINGISYYRERTTISFLANQYMEIAKNIPYADIGTLEGNPHGNLPDLPNPTNVLMNKSDYQIYYAVSYVDDPADGTFVLGTDIAPKDYKQVKLYIKNINKNTENSFLTNISPKGIEGSDSGGALYIKVFDAVGEPVSGATITIKNNSLNPTINLTRITDSDGNWIEVGLPNSDNSYSIVAQKDDYSIDKTYPISPENPYPTKPDATISNGQVTKVSFSIDKLSNLTFYTLDQVCSPISEVGLAIRGAKLIGTPDVFKFDEIFTSNSSGQVFLNDIEWDNYTPTLTETSYMIYGSSPIQEVSILPDTNQDFTLILGPKTDNSLLVIVKDASTNNSVEGAEVVLQLPDSSTLTGFTNGSIWSQQDWSGGSGQTDFDDSTKYYQDDGNVSTNEIPLGLRLLKIGNEYVFLGSLISSTFDTGTNSTSYTTLTWKPTSQDALTEIKFQIAVNNDNETWNFMGPDGTDETYYTVSGTTINNADNHRYIRYKVFLSTTDVLKTPVLSSVNVNYVSGCSTPGQTIFTGLAGGSGHQITVNMDGYQEQIIPDLKIENYNVLSVNLSQ